MELIISDLTKTFNDKTVLDSASYTFEKGKIYGLLGRNGAGKTTLFNCLTENLTPDQGTVTFKSDDQTARPISYDDIGFVFTQPHLPEFMTGYEFLKYFIDINKEKINHKIDINEAFASFDFAPDDQYKLIREYSLGMQNKLQILAFLLLKPSVLLLDEPLTSFDVIVALQIKNMIKAIKSDHIIIFSTHILQLAQDLCDDIVILNNGKLSGVDGDRLKDKDFEDQVIELLKEDSHVTH